MREDVAVENIASTENLMDPFVKNLSTRVFYHHSDSLGIICMPNIL